MSKKGQAFGVPVILIVLAIVFVLFIVLVYPSERAKILSDTGSSLNSVKITSDGFSPSDLEIPVGARVSWVNLDNTKHTVTFLDTKSNTISPGGSYSRIFRETGSYTYTSDFNPGFKGTIKVT